MAMRGGSPMVTKKGAGIVDRVVVVYRSVVEDNLVFSIVIKSLFCIRILFNLEFES